MKEAAGEANLTVITIVLVAIVLAVGTTVVRGVMNSTNRKSCCQSAGGELSGQNCRVGDINLGPTGKNTYAQCLEGK